MAMVDTGLLVRYDIAEAATGEPGTIQDLTSNNFDMTASGANAVANLECTTVSSNRGVEFLSKTGDQQLYRQLDNTADTVRTGMAGVQKATIEVVVTMTDISTSGGRLFGINGRSGQNGEFMFKGTSLSNLVVSWDDTDRITGLSISSGTRTVFQIIVDTTQATANDRIIVRKNGTLLTAGSDYTAASMPAQNATLSLGSDQDLIAGNRRNGAAYDRSFLGVMLYCALYNDALSSTDANTNYTELNGSDDSPFGGGGGGGPTGNPWYYYAQL